MDVDRWGATRKVFNLFDFPCSKAISCNVESILGSEIAVRVKRADVIHV